MAVFRLVIMIMRLFLLSISLVLAATIYIPLKINRPRCLSEYLVGATATTIKLKISFPKLDNLQPGEHYTVSLRNTETQVVTTQIVQPGDKYSREETLDQSKSTPTQMWYTRYAWRSRQNESLNHLLTISLRVYLLTIKRKSRYRSRCWPRAIWGLHSCRLHISQRPSLSTQRSRSTERPTIAMPSSRRNDWTRSWRSFQALRLQWWCLPDFTSSLHCATTWVPSSTSDHTYINYHSSCCDRARPINYPSIPSNNPSSAPLRSEATSHLAPACSTICSAPSPTILLKDFR